MALHQLSATALAAVIADGRVSAVEVTQHALDRAERFGPGVGAFTHLATDYALAQAQAADERRLRGEELPPLHGVPCPIKDLNPVKDLPLEAGSAVLRGNVADVDDDIVRWFRDAGTIMLGKTSTPEFGLPCYTEPVNCPPSRTPWDLRRSAGGSSGGAAAAVAAGIVPIAHGSDGGGSIRIPAAACGLVGLKASRGRISPGSLREPGPGLSVDGVLTRNVRDTALALDVLAGPRPGDTYHAPQPRGTFVEACEREVVGLRVGVLVEPVIADAAPVHPACRAAVNRAATLLEGLGHRIEAAPVPFPAERWQAFQALWSVGALSIPLPLDAEPLLRPLTRWLREQGRGFTGLDYARAAAAVQRLTREVAQAWDSFDLILSPTLAQPPALVGGLCNDEDPAADFLGQTRFTPWTSVYNLSGRPAISLPLHTAVVDEVELPIGVMLGARFGAEELLLSVSAALESAAPWRHPFAD